VIHHLKLRLPDERTTVLLPGFQAAGTRGRSLQDGASQIRMHGQFVPVRAKIETIDGFSAQVPPVGIVGGDRLSVRLALPDGGLVSGEVSYRPDPLEPPAPGTVLICCAQPAAEIALDL